MEEGSGGDNKDREFVGLFRETLEVLCIHRNGARRNTAITVIKVSILRVLTCDVIRGRGLRRPSITRSRGGRT